MRITDTGLGSMNLTSVYYSNADSYVSKLIAVSDDDGRDPVMPKLLSYSWFDFDKFNESDYGAELNLGVQDLKDGSRLEYSVVKIAIPKGYNNIVLYSGNQIAYKLIPSNREMAFNMVAALYSFNGDYSNIVDPGLIVHLNPNSGAHEDQIAYSTPQLNMGFLLGSNYVSQIMNRRNAVVAGTTMMIEDGCKYWLGNFDANQYR